METNKTLSIIANEMIQKDYQWKLVPFNDIVLTTPLPELDLTQVDLKKMESLLIVLSKKWNGAGLSANQIGLPSKVFVITLKNQDGTPFEKAYFNPTIEYASKETVLMEEGCLSRPGLWLRIQRPEVVRVRYWNSDGEEQVDECSGIVSRVVQHEYDHMIGSDFTKRVSKLKLDMAKKKQKKQIQKITRHIIQTQLSTTKINAKASTETAVAGPSHTYY